MSCAKEAFSVLRAQRVIFWASLPELHSQKEYTKAVALKLFCFVTLENFSSERLGACKEHITICIRLAFLRHSLDIAHRHPMVHSSCIGKSCTEGLVSVKRCKTNYFLNTEPTDGADLKFLIS